MTTNPELDLVLTREVRFAPEALWRAWTDPDRMKVWFCPKPWYVSDVEIDLRPGGRFNTVMNGPDGERFENKGCFTEVETHRKLAFTDAMTEGWRPAAQPFMSAIVTFEPKGSGTLYTATALHADPEARRKHEEMGFHTGWNTALDQLLEMLGEDA
jgi:uncharacterized protein YndB with AHSA1/START domain